jgi:hypothetical protein
MARFSNVEYADMNLVYDFCDEMLELNRRNTVVTIQIGRVSSRTPQPEGKRGHSCHQYILVILDRCHMLFNNCNSY